MGFAGYFDLFPLPEIPTKDLKDEKIEELRKENQILKHKVNELEKKEYQKLSDYEHIVISAVRYSLGRMTYIVELTINYVLQEIEDDKLSDRCLSIIRDDIKNTKNLGMDCDKKEWIKLLNRIEEVI